MQDLSFQETLAPKQNLERVLDTLTEGIIAHGLSVRTLFFKQGGWER